MAESDEEDEGTAAGGFRDANIGSLIFPSAEEKEKSEAFARAII